MVWRLTPAARAMSSMLALGSAFRVSVAACRIAAMLRRASDRCRRRLACSCAERSVTALLTFDTCVNDNLALTPVYEKSAKEGTVVNMAQAGAGLAIEAERLEKRFGDRRALAGV